MLVAYQRDDQGSMNDDEGASHRRGEWLASSTMSAWVPLLLMLASPTGTAAAAADVDDHRNLGARQSAAFVGGHVALGAGIGLAALSTTTFLAGFAVERELRRTPHDRVVVDALLLRRAVAAGIAWPTAALASGAVVTGIALLAVAPSGDDTDGDPDRDANRDADDDSGRPGRTRR
jgi:hypothetical protein